MEIEGLRIGVRCNSATTLAALRQALAVHLVDEVATRANYSVREADDAGSFHLLYRGGVVVVRTLDRSRLVRGLLTHLFGHGEPPAGLLRVDALALVRDGSAVLTPAVVRRDLARVDRRLAQGGFAVLDAPFADVDPERVELVVPPLPSSVDATPVDTLPSSGAWGRPETVVQPGCYPLASWAFPAGEETLTRAGAMQLALASSIASRTTDARGTLERLTQVLVKVRVVAVPLGPPEDVSAAFHELPGRR